MTRHLGHESMIRLDGFDGRIIALYARDMTTREIRGEAYSASVRQAEIDAGATALAASSARPSSPAPSTSAAAVRSDRTSSPAYMVKTSSGISPVPALARASHDTRAVPIAPQKSLQSALMRYTIAMTVANVAQIDSIRLK